MKTSRSVAVLFVFCASIANAVAADKPGHAAIASAHKLAPDAGFERRIGERLGAAWPEWLPELAYVLGAVLATFACVLVLPLPVANTWWIGGALAGFGLFVHSFLARALSRLDTPEA